MTKIIFCIFCLGLVLSGCGDGTYVAEKMLFHANYEFYDLKAMAKAGTMTDDEINKVILRFKEITLRFPYWENTSEAHYKIGKLREQQKNYTAAIKDYEQVWNNFPQQGEICANAQRSIANIYEMQGDWNGAEQRYKLVIEKYPYTVAGLLMPVYLARRYREQGQDAKADKAFAEALKFYQETLKKELTDSTTITLIDLATVCYLNLSEAREAIKFLKSMQINNAESVIEAHALYKTAEIFQYQLKDKEQALFYYRMVKEKYPELYLGKKSEEQIGKLSQ